MAQRDLLVRVVDVLDGAHIPYMLTGSFASSLQGEPRSTHDIDLVLDLPESAVQILVVSFPMPRYFLDRDALVRAVRTAGMANLLDTQEGDKVDFWMLTPGAFDQSRFARRMTIEFAGRPVRVSRPEDTILQKLAWSRLSGGNERQERDARRVFEVQYESLDREYLETWAARLGVDRELATFGGADRKPGA
jgi:hypothetical protein